MEVFVHTTESSPELVTRVYSTMDAKLAVVRKRLGRPLTFAEKVVFSHLDDPASAELRAGESYLQLRPDRVAMQDATAQMALLQFMSAGRKRVAVPSTVHCDHLIRAQLGAQKDTELALTENGEVYDFLASVSQKYGIGFWKPGAGIIHQVVLENYAFPGGMIIGTDSHTPNAGGLGMIACGVGGADAVDVMAGFSWEVLQPKLIGVRLTGELGGWTAPKDVILYLLGLLTTAGGTNRIIEYFGPGARNISCTGKGTITNMGAELGATTSIFPFDEKMATYLRGTGRPKLAELAEAHQDMLRADREVEEHPEKFFDKVIEIDLAKLEPHVVGPHTPDLARPISALAKAVASEGYPDNLTSALIGSCTNSSYEDLARAADVAMQASALGLKAKTTLFVSPGSEQIRATITRDGQLRALEQIGAVVLSNSCGPCIGQWKRDDIKKGDRNSIITSFNRNFRARNDSNPETSAFIASPEIVIAYSLAGRLSFDPQGDVLEGNNGQKFKLEPPGKAPEVPTLGFAPGESGYADPAENGDKVQVNIAENSERLQRLVPFGRWDGNDYVELPVLLKAKGKCTTDHISPAGPWLKYRGHLDKISDNMFTGAQNSFAAEAGRGTNVETGEKGKLLPEIARHYKVRGMRWIAVGDVNYGEGSSREHAAMSPRHLGCAAVITRSFARIHETNLKKQGILPLTFTSAADYDKVGELTRISLVGLAGLTPGKPVTARLHQVDGRIDVISLNHTFNQEQIGWFRAGSALNALGA
ncbi:MAG: aconitate hydratase [Deltaproteobacteria bacterium]|nr:aconitate hydratase [Deltaproteobacteria bacterium]